MSDRSKANIAPDEASELGDQLVAGAATLEPRNSLCEDKRSNGRVVFDVFFRDLKAILKSPVAFIVYLGLIVLPCVYAWYCIAANWDPYSNASNIKVAVAINDKPAESALVGQIDIGKTLRENLESNTQLGWTFVSEDEAIKGVEAGDYYAALVVPEDFSESFLGIFEGKGFDSPPTITYYVNEKLNGVAVKVTDTGASGIENQINQSFVGAVGTVLADKIASFANSTADKATSARDNVVQLLNETQTSLDTAKSSLSLASTSINQTRDTVLSCKNVLVEVQGEITDLSNVIASLHTSLTSIDSNLTDLINLLREKGLLEALADVLESTREDIQDALALLNRADQSVQSLSPDVENTIVMMDQVVNSMNSLQDANGSTIEGISAVQARLATLSTRIAALSLSQNLGLLDVAQYLESDTFSILVKKPVELITERIYPVENYGTGVAPFYTNLALWVGGFILVAIMRVEVRSEGRRPLRPRQAYVARGLLFTVTGMLQGLVCCLGDLAIGIQCENPLLFVLTGMFLSVVYVNIIYMLAATLKHIGKAIAVVLLIMQIPGSSGMYPIELMPQAFQAIHPFLPFTYGIGAMRETIVGFFGSVYAMNMICAAIFLLLVILIGLFVRPALLNLTLLFDEELRKTDVMICDAEDHVQNNRQPLRSLVRLLIESDKYREQTANEIKKFEQAYPKRRRRGIILMAVAPLGLFAALAVLFAFVDVDINSKVLLMFVWVLALVLTASYLIVLESIHKWFNSRAELLELGDESLARRIASQVSSQGDAS